ncbi:MAG TPA: erythromycin esterase family protein [Thermoanaerobaculia bacterium]|jgi:erythromycin esterase
MRRAITLLLAVVITFAATFAANAQRRRAVAPLPDDSTLTTTEWLQKRAMPFATTEAESGLDDLASLHPLVRNARVVALGEATHGSREFFTMKHRVLEYLVERMGFTVFAIEAALPESDAVNEYVLHGTGDPAVALNGLGFWTWDTDEVLAMIEWMRAYNLRRGERPPLSFRGFDMQSSTVAVTRLRAYLERVDPDALASANALLACWTPYMRRSGYSSRPAAERTACTTSLAQLYAGLEAKRGDYVARSSAGEFEQHLRYARVIAQNQHRDSLDTAGQRSATRDRYMAENTEWLADVAHRGEKLVLWAHNYHVRTDLPQPMGAHLRARFGRDLVVFGFVFDRGAFNAYSGGVLRANTVRSWNGGTEEVLRSAGHARMFVDLRDIGSTAARSYFRGNRTLWQIGALFETEAGARVTTPLATAYDVIIWIEETTASRLR